jgi:hypothetical protein
MFNTRQVNEVHPHSAEERALVWSGGFGIGARVKPSTAGFAVA